MFALDKAPAELLEIKTSRKAGKSSDNGNGKPVSQDKELIVEADLSHDRFTKTLDWLFPGSDLAAKGMSGADCRYEQTMTNRKKLGKVTATLHDGEGIAVVVSIVNAVLKGGSNALYIGERGATRTMIFKIMGPVGRDLLPKLDDYLRANMLLSLVVTQMETSEVIDGDGDGDGADDDDQQGDVDVVNPTGPKKKAGKKKTAKKKAKGKTTATVTEEVVDDLP